MHYESCKRNKDCAYGDCHLVPSGVVDNVFVALVVAMQGAKIRADALESSLAALAQAARQMNATVHVARISSEGLSWYAAERHLQKVCSFSPILPPEVLNCSAFPPQGFQAG
jgi:hypothetical protein